MIGVLDTNGIQALLEELASSGFSVIGPTVKDDAILLGEITHIDALPSGWIARQSPGQYRLQKDGQAYFDHVVGPQNWKKVLFPTPQTIWKADKGKRNSLNITEPPLPTEKLALFGVRGCDLAALDILDRVFGGENFQDPRYVARRKNAFIVAVNCRRAAQTCFCTSMNTGPEVKEGFDLVLTEIIEKDRHVFLVETGSNSGKQVANRLPLQEAGQDDIQAAREIIERTTETITRQLDTSDLHDMLMSHLDDEIWEDVGERCLSCANCTLVCPTCFCSTVEDVTDLTGDHAERRQLWDSCFTLDFSYIHGGSVRTSIKSRYRQWMTHKLASWVDQFGTMGCVGCGRCITWCPVGIDIIEEVQKIREAHVAHAMAT